MFISALRDATLSRQAGVRSITARSSIPACAGKPRSTPTAAASARVHPRVPRVCGEAAITGNWPPTRRGPSPRVRGSHAHRLMGAYGAGSIPACAGKPLIADSYLCPFEVHPRVCGEAYRIRQDGSLGEGPSPRVRGSPAVPRHRSAHPGSIPACAGKPRVDLRSGRMPTVHPRVCGEAASLPSPSRPARGPSPRVRGSRQRCPRVSGARRSIPACAGKPRPSGFATGQSRVHPRVCGEAVVPSARLPYGRGPSPRVRGSPIEATDTRGDRGSIPACAGKPRAPARGAALQPVHPRVCGEAAPGVLAVQGISGPSPRVRGSL